jgi:DNA-binding NarL/FixJ family response regulator
VIRVALVDDHQLVRHGIRTLLELAGGFEIVAEAADGEQALAELRRGGVDVLLLDLRMPRLGGLAVLRALQGEDTPIATLVLTTFHDDGDLLEAMRLGARGYLLKDVSLEQLVSGIRTVHAGQRLVGSVAARLGSDLGPPASGDVRPERLTTRESEVTRLMAAGYSNREIGEALGVAEGTVKNHVSVILSKLGARDRIRAVLTAIEHGLI